MDMREQKFGIEIELTGLTRQKAAEVIAKYLGSSCQYDGGITRNTVYMTIKEESGRLCMIPVLWQGKRMEPMAGMNTKWSLYPPSVNMQTSQPFRRL